MKPRLLIALGLALSIAGPTHAQVARVRYKVPTANNPAVRIGAGVGLLPFSNLRLINGAPNLTPLLNPAPIPTLAPSVLPQVAIPLEAPAVISAPLLSETPLPKAPGTIGVPAGTPHAAPVIETLKRLSVDIEKAGRTKSGGSDSLSNRFFDNSKEMGWHGNYRQNGRGQARSKNKKKKKKGAGTGEVRDLRWTAEAPVVAVDARDLPPAQPKVPAGFKRVSVDVVRTRADVDRLIPAQSNSYHLIDLLKRSISKMAPYYIYTYHDAHGGKSVGIDLGAKPGLIDQMPEQESHEVRLIRKLQLWKKDIQIIVREQGKTPDLVISGEVTELKSLMGNQVNFEFLVNKANKQVYDHAKRHGLGHGAIAIDMTHETSVPVDYVLEILNDWQKKRGRNVVVDKITVFGGSDRKVFVRHQDGSFHLDGVKAKKNTAPQHQDIARVQLLIKKGRFEAARQGLQRLESRAGPGLEPYAPISQLRETLEGERTYSKIEKLVALDQADSAISLWKTFVKTHLSEIVSALEPRIRELLPFFSAASQSEITPPPKTANIVHEITAPVEMLKTKGILATVAVYGSARILPPGKAKKLYAETLKRTGPEPESSQAKKELAKAKAAVETSRYYEEARLLGQLVAKHGGGKVAVVTGAGPGIMEAANRGALEAGGPSVGYNMDFSHENGHNDYISPHLLFNFENFATRKMSLRNGALALTYFPGGFGTMDELFEVLTLMQTGQIPRAPIILMGEKDYWEKILVFKGFSELGLIADEDLDMFNFAESAEEAWFLIQDAMK